MKRNTFVSRILACTLLASTLLSVTAMAAPTENTTTAIRVDNPAGIVSAAQTVTAADTAVTVTPEDATGSVEVTYQDETGSKTSATVDTQCPTNTIYGYVSAQGSGLRVRQGPGTNYAILATVSDGTQYAITGKTNGWYQINYNGRTGYVSADYILEKDQNGTLTPPAPDQNKNEIGSEIGTIAPPESFDGELAQRIVDYALQFKGYPYVYAEEGPTAFDCSGLTWYVYKQFGYSLYRSSKDQINNGTAVLKAELQLGDLVFFSKNGSYPTHVGLYIGNGEFIHASTPESGVKIDSLYSSYYDSDYYLGARRII